MRSLASTAVLTLAAASAVVGATGSAYADAGAQDIAANSPGVLSGGVLQVPVHVPANVCGGNLSVVGVLNPAFGNSCAND